jgi:GDPmannose 4,6-dehydratase
VGIELQWSGTGVDEIGTDKVTGIVRVQVNPKFFRPAEVEFLLGNAAKVILFLFNVRVGELMT